MAQIAKIMAATDLSSHSVQAIDRGFLVARRCNAFYTVVHALGMDALAPLRRFLAERGEDASQGYSNDARRRLAELVADSPVKADLDADLQIEQGAATDAIPECADAAGVDLLLLGAHGRGFLQRMLLGSTASRLLRKTRCPVLVVKEPSRTDYKRVLVAVDFSPASLRSLELAREIAPDAEIVLLHIVDTPFEGMMQYAGVGQDAIDQYRAEALARAEQKLKDFTRSAGLGTTGHTALVAQGDATRLIIEHEERYWCDLIVMGKHGNHLTEELLLGSVTKRVLAQSRSDVLVVIDKGYPEALRATP